MKKSRFSDHQILSILKQAENGIPVTQLCREHGMSSAKAFRSKFESKGFPGGLICDSPYWGGSGSCQRRCQRNSGIDLPG